MLTKMGTILQWSWQTVPSLTFPRLFLMRLHLPRTQMSFCLLKREPQGWRSVVRKYVPPNLYLRHFSLFVLFGFMFSRKLSFQMAHVLKYLNPSRKMENAWTRKQDDLSQDGLISCLSFSLLTILCSFLSCFAISVLLPSTLFASPNLTPCDLSAPELVRTD